MYRSIGHKRKVHTFLQSSKKEKKKKTTMRVEKYIQIQKKTGGFEKWEKVDRGKGQMKLDWNGLNVTLLLLSSMVPFSLLQPKKKKNRILKK